MVQIVLILVSLIILTATFFLLRTGFLIVAVEGQSMYPTLQHGNRILVLRLWLAGRPRKGQIVVVSIDTKPEEHEDSSELRKTCYIKRVVAVAGESFSAPLYINALNVHTHAPEGIPAHLSSQVGNWQISRDHIFVCGDNTEESIDSRSWGPLPLNHTLGCMLMKLPTGGSNSSSSALLFQDTQSAKSCSGMLISSQTGEQEHDATHRKTP